MERTLLRWLFPVALAFTVAVLVSSLTWQFASPPFLQRFTDELAYLLPVFHYYHLI